MAILVLKELGVFFHLDMSSIIDLHQFIGDENFMVDLEESYNKNKDGYVTEPELENSDEDEDEDEDDD